MPKPKPKRPSIRINLSFGITPGQYKEIMAKRSRPLTDDGMGFYRMTFRPAPNGLDYLQMDVTDLTSRIGEPTAGTTGRNRYHY